MTWRIHLSNQAIQRLDLLAGSPPLLAAWTGRQRVSFFDLETGTEAGETIFKAPASEARQGAKWQEFLAGLVAPNGAALPFARALNTSIYMTDDGRMRLYHVGRADLFLEAESKEVQLEAGETAVGAIALDRFLGLIAALDEDYRLTIYQQHIRVGVFDLGLNPDDDAQPHIAVSHGGGTIFVSDGQDILLVDSGGRTRKQLRVHYLVGQLACSPNGKLLATTDLETGVVRVYSGSDLTPTHQRHATDLLHEATQVQLIADMPPSNAALGALAVDNKGAVAFAVSGVVCVTSVEKMAALPRPQPLL